VNFRHCLEGEIESDDEVWKCEDCPALLYSLQQNSTECLPCLEHADCLGKNKVSVNPGYWRSSIYSSKIYICPWISSCLGGFEPQNEHPVQCGVGYTGILC